MQRHLPVLLKRLQFPVRLAFAMTINKSQGQSVEHVGINLQTSVFSHGQLYVAFSRCTSPLNISVLLPEQSQESRRTLNVVYKEVFNSIRLQIVYVCDNRLEIDFSYDLRDKEMSQKENPQTVRGREYSNLSDNTICYSTHCCRKEAQQTDFNTNFTSQTRGLDENLVLFIHLALLSLEV